MQIQLTQHQAIVLLVAIRREISDSREILRHYISPELREAIERNIAEKQRIAQVIDQAVNNVVLNIGTDGGITVTEAVTA